MSGDGAASDGPSLRGCSVAVIGGGPGGLFAAERLAQAGAAVVVFERMPSVGRKLLLAGRGGLNITHAEPLEPFLGRYGPSRDLVGPAVEAFTPDDLRRWCAGLGQDTFVGTSGRVFPEAMRATPLLRAWISRLRSLGVELRVRHEWRGWEDLEAPAADVPGDDAIAAAAGGARPATVVRLVDAEGRTARHRADAVVLALGGASWPRVGSDGSWVDVVERAGIPVTPLRPANCGFAVAWTPTFAERFAGVPVKNVELRVGAQRARGDAVITATGIEGGPVYAVSAALRDAIDAAGPGGAGAALDVDLVPDVAEADLRARLARRRPKDTSASLLRRVGLHPVAIGLLREATGNALPKGSDALAALVKGVPIPVLAPFPLARAISTAGGISSAAVDSSGMLRARPGTFVAGEMLDWEAPTGGYLLQATFSTAAVAADGVVRWLAG
jgi:uncharacterized flavoprotein (TIGR03862 family)